MPFKLRRDKKGEPAVFLECEHTDEIHDYLEALSNLTSSPAGIAELLWTRNNAILRLNVSKLAAAAGTLKGFKLLNASTSEANIIRVVVSNLGDSPPSGFSTSDVPNFTFTVSAGAGVVYAHVAFSTSAGTITTREITTGTTMPTASAGHAYCQLGGWTLTSGVLTPANSAYGPIGISICRDPWSNPAHYSCTLTPSS